MNTELSKVHQEIYDNVRVDPIRFDRYVDIDLEDSVWIHLGRQLQTTVNLPVLPARNAVVAEVMT